MELQTPSAPWVLSLAPPLGTLCSVQWTTVSVHFCNYQALAEPLMKQLYQAPVSKHLLGLRTVHEMDAQVGQSLDGLSFSFCSKHCLCISFHGYFDSLLKRTKTSSLWSSFFLSFKWSVNCILGILHFWANIHLSVSAYHECSFVIELPHFWFHPFA